MPYKFRKDCPICNKPDLQFLSNHIRQVHDIHGDERKAWLAKAIYSTQVNHVPKGIPCRPTHIQKAAIKQPKKSAPRSPVKRNQSRTTKIPSLNTTAYREFNFRHKFSLLVVGPTQSGKTYFVQKILETNCISYEENKQIRILWFYNQWQDRYDALRESLGKRIHFEHGLPELSDDLQEINPKYNNIIILDDLMAEATDSPLVARLFTQGRHRNASVILLLQNMFPRGKFNTDITRNAQYMALFRSPSDRKQIGIIAERMFDKNRDQFMMAYNRETEKPFGYILVDNKPDTTADKQVLGDIFGSCHCYNLVAKDVKKDFKALDLNNEAPRKRQLQENIFWSDAAIPVWQNYTNNVQYLKTMPEGFSIVEMYKTSRNAVVPNQPGVCYGGELYWPVKIRHQSNGRFKWIFIHENEPTVKAMTTDACLQNDYN